MAAKKKKNIEIVKEIIKELFDLMGTDAQAEVKEDKKNDAILIDIKTEDETGLLIGKRGETLQSIQRIVGMIFHKRAGEWQRIIVNVADWKERQEEKLTELALQTAERAKESGEEQALYNLSPAQRRVVHLALTEDKDIETESVGEGKERYLVVKPKK